MPTWTTIAQDEHAFPSLSQFESEEPEMYAEYLRLVVEEFGEEAEADPIAYAGPQRYAKALLAITRAKTESADEEEEKPVASGSKQAATAKGKARARDPDEEAYVGAGDDDESDRESSPLSDESGPESPLKSAQLAIRPRPRPRHREVPATATPAAPEESDAVREGKAMAEIRRARMEMNEVDNSDLFAEDAEDEGGPPETSTVADEDEIYPADIVPAPAGDNEKSADTRVVQPQDRPSSPIQTAGPPPRTTD